MFFVGSSVGTRRCSSVTIVDESEVVEPDQIFFVSLSTSDPVYITPTQQSLVVIIDNDRELIDLICMTSVPVKCVVVHAV